MEYTDLRGRCHARGDWWIARRDDDWQPPVPSKSRKKRPAKSPGPKRAARVFKRDGHRCKHCGTDKRLTVDHIVPKARGGTNAMDNLQTLCGPCNSYKGAS